MRIIAAAVKEAFIWMQATHVRKTCARRAAGLPHFPEPAHQRGARRGWVLQMNPQLLDLEACARKEGAVNMLLRRHAGAVKPGDRAFIWKTGKVELERASGSWLPVGGELVAIGHVRGTAEVQALPAAMAAHLRPAGKRLDPWKETVSCPVAVTRVLEVTSDSNGL